MEERSSNGPNRTLERGPNKGTNGAGAETERERERELIPVMTIPGLAEGPADAIWDVDGGHLAGW